MSQLTIDRTPLAPGARRPIDLAELVEVHDTMRAVLGDPERMDSPKARAIYLLDADRIRATRTAGPAPSPPATSRPA